MDDSGHWSIVLTGNDRLIAVGILHSNAITMKMKIYSRNLVNKLNKKGVEKEKKKVQANRR